MAPQHRYDFASDTVSSACPEAIDTLRVANETPFATSYGEDEFSLRAAQQIERILGRRCTVFFVSSSTAANAIALALLVDPTQAVLCHPFGHIEIDEANAPEHFTGGAKLLHVAGKDGKVDPEQIERLYARGRGYHSAEIGALSLTQSTELGTVYRPDEMARFQALKSTHPELKIHLDGARFANAVVATGAHPRDLLTGVDILTFGSSKNGGLPTEAIVSFDPSLLEGGKALDRVRRRLKRFGHLVAKSRYLAAPWLGMLENELWLRNATNANQRAAELAAGFTAAGYSLAVPVESNQVFVHLPEAVAQRLEQDGWHFYFFSSVGAYRFVCNWNTTSAAVQELLARL